MNNLNSIFRSSLIEPNNQEHVAVQNMDYPTGPVHKSVAMAGQSGLKSILRKERGDKRKDIKFPVTHGQCAELRRRANELRKKNQDPSIKKFETISNTEILRNALEQQTIFPDRYPHLEYADTGQYMHVKPTLQDYERLQELSFNWNLSLRQTVYRLVMNIIFRGDVDYNANRSTKR